LINSIASTVTQDISGHRCEKKLYADPKLPETLTNLSLNPT